MTGKSHIFLGAGFGFLWSIGVLAGAAIFISLPVFALIPTIMTAFLAPGLVMAAMVLRVSQRRFFEAEAGFGALSEPGEVDRRVLQNTVEQLVLAAAIWPAAAVLLGPFGPGVIMVLGLSFALARGVFWVGCHKSGGLRAAGFSMTFFPTVLVALWGLVVLVI